MRGWKRFAHQLPELPDAKYDRFVKEYGLSADDVSVLVADRAVADYFEATVKQSGGKNPKVVCNWLTGELFRYLNEAQMPIEQVKITPRRLAELIGLVEAGHDQPQHGQACARRRCSSPAQSAKAIVDAQGLAQISDSERDRSHRDQGARCECRRSGKISQSAKKPC